MVWQRARNEKSARVVSSFRFGFAGLALLVGALLSSSAGATVIERVVAIVGERPILLSELRGRAKPFEQTLPQVGNERSTALSQLYSQMLQRMVDEELVERAALQAQVKVSTEEVEAAIDRVAKGNKVEVEALFAEVERGGVARAQYRIEIRKQLLDAKLMNQRLQGRMRVTDEDIRREYDQFVREERQNMDFRAASIEIAAGETDQEQRAATELAKQLVSRARQGEDFSALSRQYTSDKKLRSEAGLWPSMRPQKLSKSLRSAVVALGVGELSNVLREGDKLVILKVIERDESGLPSFEEGRDTIGQRVQLRKMERARRVWLDGLRKRTHVEVRL